MSEEFKDVRKKLDESLREMEILKRKALRLEDENKHLVRMMINDKIKINKLFQFSEYLGTAVVSLLRGLRMPSDDQLANYRERRS